MEAGNPDADGVALGIGPRVPDVNVSTARCEVASGAVTEGDIVMTGRVAGKGDYTGWPCFECPSCCLKVLPRQ
jgi:hypothetical protein